MMSSKFCCAAKIDNTSPQCEIYQQRNKIMSQNEMLDLMEKGHEVNWVSSPNSFFFDANKFLRLNLTTWQLEFHHSNRKAAPDLLNLELIKYFDVIDSSENGGFFTGHQRQEKIILKISSGQKFVCEHRFVKFKSSSDCLLWEKGLKFLCDESRKISSQSTYNNWIQRQLEFLNSTLDIDKLKFVVKTQLQHNIENSADFQTEVLSLFENLKKGMTCSEIFKQMYKKLLNSGQLFFDLFCDKITVTNDNFISIEEFKEFLVSQGDTHLTNFYYENLSIEEFMNFLYSSRNSIFDPSQKLLQENDMTRSLTNYWISSSHNTYLSGNQCNSNSSLDSYIQVLLMGSRCIELDCWDNNKLKPTHIIVTHGKTLCSTIKFIDVLKTIKKYAFKKSEYPLILSIENHCSLKMQILMAEQLKEIFGEEMLLTEEVEKNASKLPSPQTLKRKIIIKHKKLKTNNNNHRNNYSNSSSENNLSANDLPNENSQKQGILSIYNEQANTWTKHEFFLFDNYLSYNSNSTPDFNGDLQFLDNNKLNKEEDLSNINKQYDSNYNLKREEWYHDKISKTEVAKRLDPYLSVDGTFLVRKSTESQDFTISFVASNKIHHCYIKEECNENSHRIVEKEYYLFGSKLKKSSISDLLDHYSKNKLTVGESSVFLSDFCPQPKLHTGKGWFKPNFTRSEADELLNKCYEQDKIPNGVFLIRHSETCPGTFVLSMCLYGEIVHWRLNQDGHLIIVNNTEYSNLNDFIENYPLKEHFPGVHFIPVDDWLEKGKKIEQQKARIPTYYYDFGKEKEHTVKNTFEVENRAEKIVKIEKDEKIYLVQKRPTEWKCRYDQQFICIPLDLIQENTTESSNEIEYKTISLQNCSISKAKKRIYGENAFCLKKSNSHKTQKEDSSELINLTIKTGSKDEYNEWFKEINANIRQTNKFVHKLFKHKSSPKIAQELSDLVIYCQCVTGNREFFLQQNNWRQMCSREESKLETLLKDNEINLNEHNKRHLMRIFPKGDRLLSSNLDPLVAWEKGCSMVALNYQTSDKSMQLNCAKFMTNGQSGYVLKPQPTNFNTNQDTYKLKMTIISGRHLKRENGSKGICSPFVKAQIISSNQILNEEYKTKTVAKNGLNPVWNETFTLHYKNPDMEFLQFVVEDDAFNFDTFIGQATIPLNCVRQGYRFVQLYNRFSHPIELSTLLVRVEIEKLEATSSD